MSRSATRTSARRDRPPGWAANARWTCRNGTEFDPRRHTPRCSGPAAGVLSFGGLQPARWGECRLQTGAGGHDSPEAINRQAHPALPGLEAGLNAGEVEVVGELAAIARVTQEFQHVEAHARDANRRHVRDDVLGLTVRTQPHLPIVTSDGDIVRLFLADRLDRALSRLVVEPDHDLRLVHAGLLGLRVEPDVVRGVEDRVFDVGVVDGAVRAPDQLDLPRQDGGGRAVVVVAADVDGWVRHRGPVGWLGVRLSGDFEAILGDVDALVAGVLLGGVPTVVLHQVLVAHDLQAERVACGVGVRRIGGYDRNDPAGGEQRGRADGDRMFHGSPNGAWRGKVGALA
jgi:hypothetical protein